MEFEIFLYTLNWVHTLFFFIFLKLKWSVAMTSGVCYIRIIQLHVECHITVLEEDSRCLKKKINF